MPTSIAEQLDPIFKPKSIAVIGASKNPAKWGGRVISQALQSDFRGPIYPVNPREKEIFGLKTYPDVLDIPHDVDMAVFTLPAAHVPRVMENCVKKGIKGGIIISADFAETGETGRALEAETVRIAREGGIRFVGPNGNGIWTSAVGLNISPIPKPMSGPLSFITQSGTFMGIAARAAIEQGFGLSKFISIGNQADLTATDYLEYLAQDEDTKVIALYIEGFKDGRRFFQMARKMSKLKPILIFKGGTSASGTRATLSHTASIAGADEIFDSMCRQTGLIRVFELEHLFVMAEALFSQPLPRGDRIAVVGTGGQGVTTVDLLSSLGGTVPEFKEEDKHRLKAVMPPHAPVPNNPVDFAAGEMDAAEEVHVTEMLASLDYIDGIITGLPMDRSYKKLSLADRKKALISAVDTFTKIPEKYGKPIVTQTWFVPEIILDIAKSSKKTGRKAPLIQPPGNLNHCYRAVFCSHLFRPSLFYMPFRPPYSVHRCRVSQPIEKDEKSANYVDN
ncbi:MAG: CoA-binding protein [Deltaproteobacteria bacterium]|nr:CoA-binding protein [Deltaproteobacteria bacterium]